ncbi:unnamed protein product [Trichogramma brassicae]|uniref:Uncharacterized protein n=1 Tax=Trichogramma brassicae TaxID=86971 RepID=A0A6H5I234_9HYME|nr:unnamed protein product [Trichogramma brassicae]
MATDRLTNVSPEERSHAEMERLIQDIDRRDEIIAELQSKLAEAVVEINESSLLIEKFRSDCKAKDGSKRLSKDQRELNKKMADANKRISTLEHLLERVEKDAKVKSEQIRKLKTALKETLKNQLKRSNGTSSDGENQDQLSQRSESKKEHVELLRIKENVKSIIEENEALRQGMHEILDCIHNQEGQSIVTIQSETLENLLQALDARHLAGWYHPAMRLQGRVNYLQGSNAELRAQLQQIRKNQIMLQAQIQDRSDSVEEGECSQPQSTSPPVEMSSPHRKDAMHDSPKSARSSHSQNADSGRASGKATELEEMQQADDDVAAYYGGNDTPMADDAESLGKRSEEIYAMAKEMVAQESDFRRALNDAEKKQKILEARIAELRGNLSSYVSVEEHERLKQKCLDANLRLRSALESKYAEQSDELRGKAMSELRNELVVLHSRLAQLSPKIRKNPSEDDGYSDDVMELKAENERLKKAAEIAHEEALVHREIDSTVLAEFNDLRKRIAKFEIGDGEALRETARLSLEVANRKVVEVELREKISLLERKVMEMQETMDRKRESDSDGEIAEQRQTTFSSNEIYQVNDIRRFTVPNVAILQEQLGQALALASKRALAVAKCEPGLAEYQTLVDLIEEKLTAKSSNVVPAAEPAKSSEDIAQITSANDALLSTVRSLEKLLICKDETIERYQALLKEDREKHNEAVERYQEEIQSLKKIYSDRKVPEIKLDDLDEESEYPERDIPIGETARSNRSEEILSLKEKLHRLESELNVSNEVAERWHQLAEDRLKHLDSTRQRLEQQHKEEMDSYRKELIKRQHEVNELRYQMSEVRRSAKSEIQSFMKALKIEDNKLAEEIETAEDLGLWEKLKNWQKAAERLKEKLREKTEECQKLQQNHDKLRNLIACMEREKWFLRGKFIRGESAVNVPVWPSSGAPSPLEQHHNHNNNNNSNDALVEELQRECQELRERIKELVGRLSRQDSEKSDEIKRFASVAYERPIASLKKVATLTLPRYIELMKSEKAASAELSTPKTTCYIPTMTSTTTTLTSTQNRREGTQRTKSELERTVLTLKSLVEKLQQENKRLRSNLLHSDMETRPCDCYYLRAELEKASQKIVDLETDLEMTEKRLALMESLALEKCDEGASGQVALLRQQLDSKSQLLLKVKDLLAKAVANEKALRHQVSFQ